MKRSMNAGRALAAGGALLLVLFCLKAPRIRAQGRDFDYLKGKVFDITLSVGEESPRLITVERVKIKALVEIRRVTFLVGEKWYPGRGRPTTAMDDEEILLPWDKVLYFVASSREIRNTRVETHGAQSSPRGIEIIS